MVLTRRSVLLLAADEFEDMELLYPLYRLREEDVAVTVAVGRMERRARFGRGSIRCGSAYDRQTRLGSN